MKVYSVNICTLWGNIHFSVFITRVRDQLSWCLRTSVRYIYLHPLPSNIAHAIPGTVTVTPSSLKTQRQGFFIQLSFIEI